MGMTAEQHRQEADWIEVRRHLSDAKAAAGKKGRDPEAVRANVKAAIALLDKLTE